MMWVYVLAMTAGVVMIVPTVLRAIDGEPADLIPGFVGSVGLFGGVTGLIAQQATTSGLGAFISAVAIGLAAGALHPEVLTAMRGEKNPELTHDDA